MDGYRNGASTGNASTNTRGGYNNNKNNRNKFNNGRRNSNNNNNNGGGNTTASNNNGGVSGVSGGGGGGNNRMHSSPSKQQMQNQHSPSHYSNGNGFSFNPDYNGQGYQNRNDNQRNFGNNFGNKFNNNQNSPNGGGNKKNNKFNNNKRRGGGNNYGNQSYNSYQQGNNLNGYGKNGQMNRSLSKESPNGSFSECSSNIPTSISLDNFDARQRSPVMMPSSFSFTNGSQSPSYMIKPFVPTATITEQPTAEVTEEPKVGQTINGDATSFYGSPMSHNEATLDRQNDIMNTTPTGINNSTDNDSTGSPTVVSKAESKTKTDDQISSLSSSSSPDSRNLNSETSESQLLVTASEGEFSFGTDEPSNVENTIMNPNDSVEHESLNNVIVNTKITDIDEFIKQQNDVMSTMMTTKMVTVTETTIKADLVETNASGVVNYNNANNDELDGKIKTQEIHEHESKKSQDEHNTSNMSSSSSSSSSGSSTTMSSTTTSSPQSSIDPSSSSSSSTSFSNQHGSDKTNDAAGCLDKDAINIKLDIEYDSDEKEPTPKPQEHKTLDREITSDDFKGDFSSLTHSTSGNQNNADIDSSTTALYPSLQSNAISEMETIIHQSSEAQKDEEVTGLVSKLVSDVINQAIQTAPAPMAYDEIEMDDDDEPAKPDEKTGQGLLVAFDNDHGSYYKNHDGQEEETAKTDMSHRESIINLKKIDEDEEDGDKLQIDVEKNVSFTRRSNEDMRRALEHGNMNSPTGEIDLSKMEAMNSVLTGKTASATEAKPQTSKSSKKSQEPVVDCFSCNII